MLEFFKVLSFFKRCINSLCSLTPLRTGGLLPPLHPHVVQALSPPPPCTRCRRGLCHLVSPQVFQLIRSVYVTQLNSTFFLKHFPHLASTVPHLPYQLRLPSLLCRIVLPVLLCDSDSRLGPHTIFLPHICRYLIHSFGFPFYLPEHMYYEN